MHLSSPRPVVVCVGRSEIELSLSVFPLLLTPDVRRPQYRLVIRRRGWKKCNTRDCTKTLSISVPQNFSTAKSPHIYYLKSFWYKTEKFSVKNINNFNWRRKKPLRIATCGGADGAEESVCWYCCTADWRGMVPMITSTGTFRSKAGPEGSITSYNKKT